MECTLYLTEKCNLRCNYCYQGNSKIDSFLTRKNLIKSLEYIVENNQIGDSIDIVFLGGEPLLNHRALYGAVNIIKTDCRWKKERVSFQITTNGILLNEQRTDFLHQNKFKISISIDGDRETHNLNRISMSNKDVYDIILNNMKNMIERNIDFSVRMTLTANNVHLLYHNVEYFIDLGVKEIHIGVNQLDNWSQEQLEKLDKQLDILDNYYLQNIVDKEDYLIDIYDYKIATFLLKKTPQYCSAGSNSHIIINSKGEIYPCGYVTNNEVWNIGSVDTFLERKKFIETVKRNIKEHSDCHECELAFTCSGAKCGFLNFVLTGKLNQNGKITCQLEKIFYKHNLNTINTLFQQRHKRVMKYYDLIKSQNLEFSNEIIGVIEKSQKA